MKVWHLPENVSVDICTMMEKAMVGNSAETVAQVKAVTLNCTNNYCSFHWQVLTHTKKVPIKNVLDEALNIATFVNLILQYFGHLMQRVDSLEKTLMLGGIGGRRRRGRQRMRWLDGITNLMYGEFEWTPGVGDGQGGLACCDSWGRKESDTTERLNWIEWHRSKARRNN